MKRVIRLAFIVLIAQLAFSAVSPADLRAHVEFLASDVLEGRSTPSTGLNVAAEYIAAQFKRAGLEPQPDGTYFQVASEGRRNVVGVLRGSHRKLRDQYVLVTAHYDHVGVKKEAEPAKGDTKVDGDLIFNGANDNASGVASMIEIARSLAARQIKPRRTIVFIAYYGEEEGMVGSRYYAENPLFPIESTVAQINIEQTGRPDDMEGPNAKTFNVTGYEFTEVAGILRRAALLSGVHVVRREKWTDLAFERSDNEALAKRGVPAHTISAAYMFPDYHRVSDHADKLDYRNMARITDAAARGVAAIANRFEPPHWYEGVPYGGTKESTGLSKPIAPKSAPPAAKKPKPAAAAK